MPLPSNELLQVGAFPLADEWFATALFCCPLRFPASVFQMGIQNGVHFQQESSMDRHHHFQWLIIILAIGFQHAQSKYTMTEADLILYNGNIQTVDDSLTVVKAIAIADGRIIGLGSDSSLTANSDPKNRSTQRRNAYRVLSDPHCHFYGYGLTLRHTDLKGNHQLDRCTGKASKASG